jgi:hypothetical protein
LPGISNTLIGKWGDITGQAPPAATSYSLALVNLSGNHILNFAISDGIHDGNVYVNWVPQLNTWYHVAVVYSTQGTARFYVNGDLVGVQEGLPNSINDSSAPLLVGQYGNSIASGDTNGYYVDGLIDDVRIYNVARTQEQIQSDYKKELTGKESGLVAYWNFDNNYNDLAGGNTLTPVNGATFSSQVPNQLKDKSNNGKQK